MKGIKIKTRKEEKYEEGREVKSKERKEERK